MRDFHILRSRPSSASIINLFVLVKENVRNRKFQKHANTRQFYYAKQ